MTHRNITALTERLLFPAFDGDCRIILPGETVKIDCSDSPPEQKRTADGFNESLWLLVEAPSEDAAPLILHPSVSTEGERLRVALTNASSHTCIIAKDSFDIASRLGHGIFRAAEVIPYEHPIARAVPLPRAGKVCVHRETN